MNIAGKTILVTGAAGGLGQRFVEALLAANAASIVALDINKEKLAALKDKRVSAFACDISDAAQIHACLEQVYAKHPAIDILINNGGILHSAPLVNILEKDESSLQKNAAAWNQCIGTNLSSAFYISQFVARRMAKARTPGVIINMSSVSAQGNAGQSAYSASKAGIEALTNVWAKELGAFGIRSVAIAPGYMDTPSTHAAVSEAQLKDITQRIPMKKLGAPESIVEAMLFAIQNDYLNGTVLEVHGGLRV